MPTLAELQRRPDRATVIPMDPLACEESLIADIRASVSPAQFVEQKFFKVLEGPSIVVLSRRRSNGAPRSPK